MHYPKPDDTKSLYSLKCLHCNLSRLKLVAIRGKGELPVLLVGDFNTWRPKRMQMLHDSIHRLNLQPVHFEPEHQNQLKRFLLSDPLDHVFYRGLKLQPKQTTVLADVHSSDHKPMIVTFQLPSIPPTPSMNT